MNLQVDIAWPEGLPLPREEYSGYVRNGTITSSPSSPPVSRRSRFERSYSLLAVKWVLTPAELTQFKAFFLDDLGNGAAQFQIELRYPINSELTEWAVRFEGGYSASYEDGMWTVDASLDLVNPVVF